MIFNKLLFISLRLSLYNSPSNQTLRRAFDICEKTFRTAKKKRLEWNALYTSSENNIIY